MHPKLAQAIHLRGEKRYDEARSLFDELLGEYPNDGLVNYHYAWLHDNMGLETQAIPFYERALALGLPDEDMRGALLGLGSTYRCTGHYDKAAERLQQGRERFPNAGEFPVFLAMTRYNQGHHAEAMSLLLALLADTSADSGIQAYQTAIRFYADRLDDIW
jgi:tetratricopeptide (TPR) repeat protein